MSGIKPILRKGSYAEVIGDPIAQSKSPAIHNFWLGKLGIDAEYRVCHVRADDLEDYLRTRNGDDDWRGCNVTMPHKQSVIPLLDELSPAAKRIGAVNTITMSDYHLHGDNTDGLGFLEPLKPLIAGKEHKFAYLIGSGGAARAIADALYEARFTIVSYSRDPAKTDQEIGRYIWDKDLLVPLSRLEGPCEIESVDADGDAVLRVLINATPLGMVGHGKLNMDPACMYAGTVFYDIVTSPLQTELLQTARARGFRTIDGLAMLIGQAALAFELFFGQPAPRQHDAQLRAILTP